MSDRQKLFYALLASVFVHIAIAMVLTLWTGQHVPAVVNGLPALPDLRQLTVTIMSQPPAEPPPAIAAPTPGPPPVIDSDGLTHSSAKPPANPVFQSDANMIAGSQLPATGSLPLPSLAGPKRKVIEFSDQAASMGKGETPPQPAPAHPPAPAAMPVQTPSAITRVFDSPAPAPSARPTPAPTAPPDTLALGTPTPTPAPTPVAELARLNLSPSLRDRTDMAPVPPAAPAQPASPAQPAPPRPPEPSTQRETQKSRVDGGITAPGPPGVDAEETPFGRYHHKLYELIGSRWRLYLQEHPNVDVGDVTILVTLAPSGKVARTRVLDNHALDELADISTKAILDSDLPPVPGDLAPMLRDGKLEVTFSFGVYDPSP
jgi:hypothetical protein